MFKPAQLLVFITLTATTACTAPPGMRSMELAQSAGPQCFRANELRGFSPGPDGLVNIQTAGNRWFQMRLSSGCPEFGWIMKIGIRPVESSWLCEGKGDRLIEPNPAGLNRCFVSDIRPIAPSA